MTKRNLYIAGTNNRLFIGNILNIANKIRCWDMPNVKALAGDFKKWYQQSQLDNRHIFQERWEEKLYEEVNKGRSYHNVMLELFKFPNISIVRKIFV